MKVRVEFLQVRLDPLGARQTIIVEVPHLSRAEYVAREQAGGLRHDEWHVLTTVEVEEVPAEAAEGNNWSA